MSDNFDFRLATGMGLAQAGGQNNIEKCTDEIEEYQLEEIRTKRSNDQRIYKAVQMEYKKLKNATGYQAPVLYNTSSPSNSPDLD